MINLTKALSEEFGPQGIRVNGMCLGPVRTPWWTDERGAADILALSPHAASTTGTEVVVDSGMMKT
jgi:NAD(P)-dependent dehydrogenase (short-subunit alcohol dehydrogenase family)